MDDRLRPHAARHRRCASARRRGAQAYVKDGKIVLNLSASATQRLQLGNEEIEFDARFAGVVHHVRVPIAAVLGIYARETGEGMVFSEQDLGPEPPSRPTPAEEGGGARERRREAPAAAEGRQVALDGCRARSARREGVLDPLHARILRRALSTTMTSKRMRSLRVVRSCVRQQQVGGANDSGAFAPVDARGRAAIPLTRAGADLDDHEHVAVAGDQVDLAEPPAKVAHQDLEPVARGSGRDGLSRAAQLRGSMGSSDSAAADSGTLRAIRGLERCLRAAPSGGCSRSVAEPLPSAVGSCRGVA